MPCFLIKADKLYELADSEAGGSLEIVDAATSRVVLVVVLGPSGDLPSVLTISSAASPQNALASGVPCMVGDNMCEDVCAKVDFRTKDRRIWGSMSPIGNDVYGVFQGRHEPALTVHGDQEKGNLTARMGGEVVAHAVREVDGDNLEVGVKPHIDPILVLLCVLGLVIFDPEEVDPSDPSCGR